MTPKQKNKLVRIIISAVLLVVACLIPYDGDFRFVLFLPPYFIVGWDVLLKAGRNIINGRVFDENFLMTLATIGAFATGFFGEGEYPEAVFVMLFYQVGELFQSYAVGRSRKSIAALMDIRPDTANVLRNGKLVETDPEDVLVGEEIVVRPGEKIPLDGKVIDGSSSLNTSALTGESLPKDVFPGDVVTSGCVNLTGVINVRVEKLYGESTVAKILELLENSSAKKAKTENFITRFSRVYTPVVVLCAVLLAVIPPLFFGNWAGWIRRALMFLVVSCPCALVVSVPLSFFGGIGGASKNGILIKGGNYLEALADVRTAVFDKTGTLTKGRFSVTEIRPESGTAEELLNLTALAESYSSHPVSKCIRETAKVNFEDHRVEDVKELSGRGVVAKVDGREVAAGNSRLLEELEIPAKVEKSSGTTVYVSAQGKYLGSITVSDTVKENAKDTISSLKRQGVDLTVMLSGDRAETANAVAESLGMDRVYSELMPSQKVERVEEILEERKSLGKLVFVGDGINDAPVLSRADVGIAMGGLGSDAAIEAADVVLMDDDLSKIPLALEISKGTLRIVRENIFFALFIKAVVLLLSALGLSTMWEAVFADVGVLVIAVLNAMRSLSLGRKKKRERK